MEKITNTGYWTELERADRDRQDISRTDDKRVDESQAPTGTTKIDRRSFLELLVLSFAATSCGKFRKPVQKIVPMLNKPEYLVPGVANWYASTCGGCPASCGTLVKVRDGRPIKLEGNPEHPLNPAGLCAVGQASLLGLYDSQRLKQPMKGTEVTDWETVDKQIVEQLKTVQSQGKKIVLLTGTLNSPTTRDIVGRFLQSYQPAEHITYEALSCAAIRRACQQTFGQAIVPTYRLDHARVIVSFDADFLGTWLSPVEFTKQYTQSRQRSLQERTPFTHVQFESRLSLTGSNAEERIPVSPDQRKAYLLWLCKLLAKKAGRSSDIGKLASRKSLAAIQGEHYDRLNQLATLLWKNRRKSLILSGTNDVETQVLVNYLNLVLRNVGRTVLLSPASLQNLGEDDRVGALVEDMRAGKVGALLIYGCNPAYTLPQTLNFGEALKNVPVTVSFNQWLDETTALANYKCPDHHYMESWNDAEPQTGLFSIFQPTIRPLGNSRPFQESLLRWIGVQVSYYDYLKEYWRKSVFTKQSQVLTFFKFWEKALLDGYVDLRRLAPVKSRFRTAPLRRAIDSALSEVPAGDMVLDLYANLALRDGAYAGNPYLLEFPDPVSKVCWSNYASLAPATARELGIKEGQYLRISAEGQTIEIPAKVQPGQHPRTISIAFGYGREKAGNFGTGVGVDAYPLVTEKAGTFRLSGQSVEIEPLPRFKKFALTQTEGLLHDRPLVLETSLSEVEPSDHVAEGHDYDAMVIWHGHRFEKHKWEMAIDLNKCTGCSACIVACEIENNIPVVGEEEVRRRREMHWIRIDRYYKGGADNPEVRYQPMPCQQCDNAPCESVCPVLATVQSSEGLNMQVYNRCVGTRFCANNCPYKVRRFNWFEYPHNDLSANLILNPDVTVRSRGVMEKCTFCVQRIQAVKIQAKKEGRPIRDQEIQTACQQSCPADAIVFGDANDPESKIAKLKQNSRSFKVLEELYVKPAVTYLKKVHSNDA